MKKIVVTGGAGFIGSNLVDSLLADGSCVTVLDSLTRRGTEHNLDWLKGKHSGNSFTFVKGDVRDAGAVGHACADADLIFHLAGQVAVTSSVEDPREDFEVNALGTLNVLEAARSVSVPPAVIYTSTNKVYGGMEDVRIEEMDTRYAYRDLPGGISEAQPLDFHSPYGCSKGAADQYVRDYARIYGLKSVVFRMSCIYGPRQFGNEDQGWLAHLMIAAMMGRPISIYGNGKQVRDILYVHDLVRALRLAAENVDSVAGETFNVGGGPLNTLSIWQEFQPHLSQLAGRQIEAAYGEWRPGDQPIYVSDIGKVRNALGWEPQVDKSEGTTRLWAWLEEQRSVLEDVLATPVGAPRAKK